MTFRTLGFNIPPFHMTGGSYKTCMTFLTMYILNISSFRDASIFLSLVLQNRKKVVLSATSSDMQLLKQLHDAPHCSLEVHRGVGQHKKAVLPWCLPFPNMLCLSFMGKGMWTCLYKEIFTSEWKQILLSEHLTEHSARSSFLRCWPWELWWQGTDWRLF